MPTLIRALMFGAAFLLLQHAHAQRPVKMHTIWDRPQVRVVCQDYNIYFTINDIDRALALMAEAGDSTFGSSCGLDTAATYTVEVTPGLKGRYINPLQILIQKGVGAFLLSTGRALVKNPRGKKLYTITMDIQPVGDIDDDAYLLFTDPKNNKLFFTGRMAVSMYNKDIGLE